MAADFNLELAVRTVWMEARGEGHAGIDAVAWVIVNRARAGRWYSGGSLAACCLFPFQFSCWNTADPNRLAMAGASDDDPIVSDCRRALLAALGGTSTDPTDGATHYFDVRMVTPPAWAAQAIRTCQIGHHAFCKGIA